MWVLLLLGLLPLAVFPTMLGGSDDSGADSSDDDGDGPAGSAEPGPDEDGFDWISDAEDAPARPIGQDAAAADPAEGEVEAEAPEGAPADFVPTTFALGIGDGVTIFGDFVPGEDSLEVHVDPEGPSAEVTSGVDEGGAWVQVRQGDALAEARFPGLSAPPLDDIHLVSGLLEPDLSDDDLPSEPPAEDPDEAGPLAPVTDDVDAPGGDDPAEEEAVLLPVMPPEEGR
jgi:hypothetical protein